jgi:hypothetical protein
MRIVFLVSMIAANHDGTESTYPLFVYENPAEAIRSAERLRSEPDNRKKGYTYAVKDISMFLDGNG